MNDDEEFTLVDETFGVREASDCSDDGSEKTPQGDLNMLAADASGAASFTAAAATTVASAAAKAAASTLTASSRNSSSTVHTERTPVTPIVSQETPKRRGEERAKAAGTNPKTGADVSAAMLNQATAGRLHKPSNSNSVNNVNNRSSDTHMNSGAKGSRLPRGGEPRHHLPQTAAVVGTTSGGTQQPLQQQEEEQQQQRNISKTKALTVRLVPGDCAFGAVVPREGATVGDLESELQRKLGLRRPVHLTSVQVLSAGAQEIALPNAPDAGTITARPVDCVLVRARLFRGFTGTIAPEEIISLQATDVSSKITAPSAWDQFVPLLLRSTWAEAMDVVRTELGVPMGVDRGVEVRRIPEAHAFGSPDRETELRSVSSLRNGDTLVLRVDGKEEGLPPGGVAGADVGLCKRKLMGENKPGAAGRMMMSATVPGGCHQGELVVDANDGLTKGAGANGVVVADGKFNHTGKGKSTPITVHAPIIPGSPLPRTLAAGGPSCAVVTALPSATASDVDPRHVGTKLPPLPCPRPPSATVDPLFPVSPFGFPPACSAFGREQPKPKQKTEASTSASFTAVDDTADDASIAELVGMGFDKQHVMEALKKCGRGDSWKETAISLLLEPQISRVDVSGDDLEAGLKRHKGEASSRLPSAFQPSGCPICMSDIPRDEVFTVDCTQQHTFCVDCLYQHCSVQLLDLGLIPACPLSTTTTCDHELCQEEVERVFLLKTYCSVHDGSGPRGKEKDEQAERDKRALDACRTLLTRRGLDSTGAVPCVSAECGNWMVPEGASTRVKCSSCLTEFCTSCKRSPYHYAAECGDVVRLVREWSLWLTEGKAAFLRTMAAQDDEHKALLTKHEKRMDEHNRAVQEAERLRLEYDKMETWKELRCRCCPSCGRTIEKISGCDIMYCGKDAHGGNIQNGCGTRFCWSVAKPYVGDRGVRKVTPFTEREPQAAARTRHFIAATIPLRCDRCHQDVVGPLFRCIHCPSFACCLECQDAASRDPRHVHHTFQVVGREDESSPPDPAAATAGKEGGRGAAGACDMDVDDLV